MRSIEDDVIHTPSNYDMKCYGDEMYYDHHHDDHYLDDHHHDNHHHGDHSYTDRKYSDNSIDLHSYDNYYSLQSTTTTTTAPKHRYNSYDSSYDFKVTSDHYDFRDEHYDPSDIDKSFRTYSFDEPGSTSSGSLSPDSVDLEFHLTPFQLAQRKKLRKPPEGYLCHLCFCKGHYIKDCPQVSHLCF